MREKAWQQRPCAGRLPGSPSPPSLEKGRGHVCLELRELDGAAVASVTYSFSDELKATAGAVFVLEGPDEAGTYGAFKDLSCVRLGATYSF